jgi:hypothetical protein
MSANRSSRSGRWHDNVVELAAVRSRYAGSHRPPAASGAGKGDKQRPFYSVLIVFPTHLVDGRLMVGG